MKIAFVFPGQGSQAVGMGKDLYEGFDEVKNIYQEASDALGYDVAKLSFEGPEAELNRTERTQPCLLTASIAAYTALSAKGIRAEAMAGHSLGEYSALVAAGAMGLRDAVRITEVRGRIMQEAVPEGKGMMAAVLGLKREPVDAVCDSITSGYVAAANYNCPGQIVISGEKQAVEDAMDALKTDGAKRVVPLAVSVPSHSKLMEGASKKLSEYLSLDEFKMQEPSVPVVNNAEAAFVTAVDDIKAALIKQLWGPVLWEDCVAAMVREGFDTFVEVGPGKVLSGLIRRCDKDVKVLNVGDLDSLEACLSNLGG